MSGYVNTYAKANRLEIREKLKAAIMKKWHSVYHLCFYDEETRIRFGQMAEEAAYGILHDEHIEVIVKKRSG